MPKTANNVGRLILQGQYIGEITNEDNSISKFRLESVLKDNTLGIMEEQYLNETLIYSKRYTDVSLTKGTTIQLTSTGHIREGVQVIAVDSTKKSILIK